MTVTGGFVLGARSAKKVHRVKRTTEVRGSDGSLRIHASTLCGLPIGGGPRDQPRFFETAEAALLITRLMKPCDRCDKCEEKHRAAAARPSRTLPEHLSIPRTCQCGYTTTSVADLREHIRREVGGLQRLLAQLHGCGMPGGYKAHRRKGEPACDDCRAMEAAYQATRYQARKAARRGAP